MAESTYLISRDVGTVSIGGSSVLAVYREATLDMTTDTIDVSAAQDDFEVVRPGRTGWTLTCRALIDATPVFHDLHIARAEVVVAMDIDGVVRYGSGFITASGANVGDAETSETVTIKGDGTIG